MAGRSGALGPARSASLALNGEPDAEVGVTRARLDLDASAVGLADGPHQGQSQARPSASAGSREEALEDLGQVAGTDAGSVVDHMDADLTGTPLAYDTDLDLRAAVLDGIVDFYVDYPLRTSAHNYLPRSAKH